MRDLFNILIVVIYLCLIYKFQKNMTLILLFTLATILILCNISKVHEGYSIGGGNWASSKFKSTETGSNVKIHVRDTDYIAKDKKKHDVTDVKENKVKENKVKDVSGYSNVVIPSSPYGIQMGPYDQLVLTTGNPKSEYLKLKEAPLVPKEELCIYQGHENPLKCQKTTGLNMGPSVDGTPTAPKSLFPFTFNKSSPACCPSTFSTSTGCVCTTKAQRDFINGRGMGNN